MTWILWLFLSFVSSAHAQCNGSFGAGQICGNPLSTAAPPRPMAATPGVGTNVTVKCDGSTDNSATINAAIATLPAGGSSTINLVPSGSGACNLGNTVLVNGIPNVRIVAAGYGGGLHNVGTVTAQCSLNFTWTGSAGGTMFKWTTNASGASAQGLTGGGLEGVCLDGVNSANIGLDIVSLSNGSFSYLYFQNFSSAALLVDIINNTGSLMGDPCDSQRNIFQQIVIDQISASGVGIQLNGYQNVAALNGGCNASINTFNTIQVYYFAHTGILENGADNNKWFNIGLMLASGGTADCVGSDPCGWDFSISTTGPGTPNPTNSEYIFGATIPTSKLRGTTTFPGDQPVYGITIYGLDKGNGSADPILEAGASGQWYDSSGIVVGPQYAAPVVISNNTSRSAGTSTYLDIQVPNGVTEKLRIASPFGSGGGSGGGVVGYEAISSRGDGNSTFGSVFGASYYRTDGTAITSPANLGYYTFGGQWGTSTVISPSAFLYSASIMGIAEGSFTAANTMPTGIVFNTGSAGSGFESVNTQYGTERMRITNTGGVNVGTFSGDPGAGNLTVANTTTTTSLNVTATLFSNTISAGNTTTPVKLTNTSNTLNTAVMIQMGAQGSGPVQDTWQVGVLNDIFTIQAIGIGPVITVDRSGTTTLLNSGNLSPQGNVSLASGKTIAWNFDTGVSRDSAAVIDFGNGTAADSSATLQMSSFFISGTPKFNIFTTGAGTQTFTNSPCSALTTERWIKVTFSGSTSQFFIPSCS